MSSFKYLIASHSQIPQPHTSSSSCTAYLLKIVSDLEKQNKEVCGDLMTHIS